MIKVTDKQHKIIIDILKEFVPHCEVRAFGSRYKGTPKDYSDLDLAVVGEEKLDWHVIANLKYAFEESDLPYRVDVLDWHSTSPEFRKVIEKGYEVVYQSTGEVYAALEKGYADYLAGKGRPAEELFPDILKGLNA